MPILLHMKHNQTGLAHIAVIILSLILVVTAFVGWLVYDRQKTTTSTSTNTISENKKPKNVELLADGEIEKVEIKGWTLIYNPEDPALTLEGQVFEPNVWYLMPREVKWPGNQDTNYRLDLSSATCLYLDSAISDKCNSSEVMWGYGDRVTIEGQLKDGKTLKVGEMIVVSSQPEEKW